MHIDQGQQLLPKIRVQRGLLVALDPPPLFPASGPPLLQGINDILGVGVEVHGAGFLQHGQGGDHRRKLHAVVGGGGFSPGDLLLVLPIQQHRPPAPRAGVAGAGAVGVDADLLHGVSSWGAEAGASAGASAGSVVSSAASSVWFLSSSWGTRAREMTFVPSDTRITRTPWAVRL